MGKASRAKRLRRERLVAGEQALLERVHQWWGDKPYKLIPRPCGRKMSDIVIELADPWLSQAESDANRKKVLLLAINAWNLALLPEPKRWNSVTPKMTQALGELGIAVLKDMVARKLELFPDVNRPILDCEIVANGGRLRVNVISPVTPEQAAQAGFAQTGEP